MVHIAALWSLIGSVLLCVVVATPPCTLYPRQYSCQQLLQSEEALEQFLAAAAFQEGYFGEYGVGIDEETGYTYDGHPLNYDTGELESEPHLFSAPSKEGFHVAILAQALSGNSIALKFVHSNLSFVLQVLERKIRAYKAFNSTYPGYGGFMPWVSVGSGALAPLSSWENRVPSLDNG